MKPEHLQQGKPIIPCGCCHGTGKVVLGDDLWRTLSRLDETPRATDELTEEGVTRNAINNRLIALEALGLIECVGKRGKWRMWVAMAFLKQRTAN